MKFQATVVFEFAAHDAAEAGERLNALRSGRVKRAWRRSRSSSRGDRAPVSLPTVTPRE
jgi:hypothetical protein